MHVIHTFSVVAALMVGCTAASAPAPVGLAPSSTAPSTRPVASTVQRDVRAPVFVSWVEHDARTHALGTPGRYVLSARVEQPGSLGLPLNVRVLLPAGVTLVRGPSHWVVQPGPPGTVHDTVIELLASTAPTDDLVLVADVQGEHAGIHAEARYRFGRPEPQVAQPPLAPTDLVVGGHNFGRPVQMHP
jgi:hypothetical protein